MLYHILAFVLGFLVCKYSKQIKQKTFPTISGIVGSFHPNYDAYKEEVFKQVKEVQSYFPEMRTKKSIKILEIGVGKGSNFKFYPDGCHLTVIDPNPNFKSYYNENRSKYPQIESEDILVCKGEDMHMVPDNSVDVVVVSRVLCSVEDTAKVLQQILRVLVPGGKFFFFEHVKEFDLKKNGRRALKQEIFTRSRVWPTLLDDCEVNRDTLSCIQLAGFSSLDYNQIYVPGLEGFMLDAIKPHLVGCASK